MISKERLDDIEEGVLERSSVKAIDLLDLVSEVRRYRRGKKKIKTQMKFDGDTIEPEDVERLATQYKTVFGLMKDGEWRTLERISNITGFPQASISARLRDMRKKRNGEHVVKRIRTGGLHHYRLIVEEWKNV